MLIKIKIEYLTADVADSFYWILTILIYFTLITNKMSELEFNSLIDCKLIFKNNNIKSSGQKTKLL